jgi:PPOX class probable FMN-dependent enzyme
MNRAQQKFGEPIEFVRKKIFSRLPEVAIEFIQKAPFAVLSTANAQGDCDASPKGGQPGFVKVLDDEHLLVPDVAGNKLFQSYENVESNPKAGLLFLIPGCDWTVRVNGRVTVLEREGSELRGVSPEVFSPDDNTKLLQGMLVEVEEVYAHCPRAFTFSKLWDAELIAEAQSAEASREWAQKFIASIRG